MINFITKFQIKLKFTTLKSIANLEIVKILALQVLLSRKMAEFK